LDERSSLGTVSKRERFSRNARARNTHVEATLNHPCAAQVAITKLESELADKRRQLQALEECSDLEMVFGRRHAPQKEDLDLSREVAKLEDWKLAPARAGKW